MTNKPFEKFIKRLTFLLIEVCTRIGVSCPGTKPGYENPSETQNECRGGVFRSQSYRLEIGSPGTPMYKEVECRGGVFRSQSYRLETSSLETQMYKEVECRGGVFRSQSYRLEISSPETPMYKNTYLQTHKFF